MLMMKYDLKSGKHNKHDYVDFLLIEFHIFTTLHDAIKAVVENTSEKQFDIGIMLSLTFL